MRLKPSRRLSDDLKGRSGLKDIDMGFPSPCPAAPDPELSGDQHIVDNSTLVPSDRRLIIDGATASQSFLEMQSQMMGKLMSVDSRGLCVAAFDLHMVMPSRTTHFKGLAIQGIREQQELLSVRRAKLAGSDH